MAALLLTACGSPNETPAPPGTLPLLAPIVPATTAQAPLTAQDQSASTPRAENTPRTNQPPLATGQPTTSGQPAETGQPDATAQPPLATSQPDATAEPAPPAATQEPPTTAVTPATAQPDPTAAYPPTEAPAPTDSPTTTPFQPEPSGQLAPIQMGDHEPLSAALSPQERECITQNGTSLEELPLISQGIGKVTPDENARMIQCLSEHTLARIFLGRLVPGPEPLSIETSNCVRQGFNQIDLKGTMIAGNQENPAAAMAGSMTAFAVATACLNDEEWADTATHTNLTGRDREQMICLLKQTGGPQQMAEVITQAQKGDLGPFFEASLNCGMSMGPPGSQLPQLPGSQTHPTQTP